MSLRTFLGARSIFAGGLACASLLAFDGTCTQAAAQSLEDCGNIYVEAEATCQLNPPSVNCDVACQPIRVQAACAGEAYVQCEGGCDADLDVGCTTDCEATCTGQCTRTPGEFDCQAYCQADCSADCTAQCQKSGDKTRCEASCRGSCTGDCDAHCNIKAPTVDCMAECKASCTGSCHAKANVDCQIDCQSEFYVECEADLSGGCKAQCTSEQGALFCDGNYVETRDNVNQCIEALREKLDVQVETYANGECVNNTCAGEAGGSASCSAMPGGNSSAWGGLSLLGGLGVMLLRRRRRQ